MDPGALFLFFGGLLALATVLVVGGLVQARRRRAELSSYAAGRRWTSLWRDARAPA